MDIKKEKIRKKNFGILNTKKEMLWSTVIRVATVVILFPPMK